MKHLPRLIILFVFFFHQETLQAQNITGSWEGTTSGEYFQVNIQQKNNELCGYTYDYELSDRYSYCAANFMGRYDSSKKIYFINGTDFIENSGSHVLMRILLWKNKLDPNNVLRGKIYLQSSVMSLFGMGGDDIMLKRTGAFKKIAGIVQSCFPEPIKRSPAKTAPVKHITNKPVVPKPAPAKTDTVRKDTVKNIITRPVAPVIIPRTPTPLENVMMTRKQNQQSRVSIDVNEINLKVYDNGIVDNDSVSIFYNGRLLLSHQRLSEKAIELNIKLDEGVTQHVITMFAENLGTIPPNTALIVVTAGNKRYELHSKASLEENAVLIFDYKPK